ncbi:glycoside hydrolase family 3 protein [Ruminococcus flavefaciens]|uniref:beta-glucosidase n=1 Tax=Ruminococcus flavefaciens TaxID=1265 RepID=A0A1M7MLM1_RUMFL|nr:glycoside hydrolase family 3 protein [Ruminococcus flavefaciens]SHM91751.1 beta-glucosidase [Ruminococcus flavefaciens]
MKKIVSLLLSLAMITSLAACADKKKKTDTVENETTTTAADTTDNVNEEQFKYQKYASMTPEEITAQLTLEQKAAQMVQPAIYAVLDNPEKTMEAEDYGSILGELSGMEFTSKEWQEVTNEFQNGAIKSGAGIPFMYGSDHAHGVNYCLDSVIFPHNIGLGAANDEELVYEMGQAVADEARICHIPWNFFPVVTPSVDPRWGRTYECYSSDLDIVSKLGSSYIKGYIDGGGITCAKHFFAEGSAAYGTGEDSMNGQQFVDRLIDRGEATLSDEEIEKLLKVYQDMIDAGTQTIMISHASLNGVKMHENKKYIMMLKEEMGFEGFIVSDWESIQNIPDKSYEEQVIAAVNAGIDMLMEPNRFDEAKEIIIDAVKNGKITEERVNDAVTRIIKVKKDNGYFDDPLFERSTTKQKDVGSVEYRQLAEKLVEESLVLLKNDNNVLPIKSGSSVYIIGPASDDASVQCGGWTLDWAESFTKNIQGATTILEAFKTYAESYGITVITNPDEAQNADVVVNVVGEQVYSEWNGDTEDMKLCGKLGLDKNRQAFDEAKKLGKPTVTCIVAGRQVILDKADYDSSDSVVMCYLPGSEGKGVSDVLCGCADFKGKLPSPWYESVDQIGTDKCWLEKGYGLTYGEDFEPVPEPVREGASADASDEAEEDPMTGTKYTKGEFKDGVYTNEYAKLKIKVPENLPPQSETALKSLKASVTGLFSDDRNKAFENATAWDCRFTDDKNENVVVRFVNIKNAFPNSSKSPEEELLEIYRERAKDMKTEYKERAKIKLCGEEYTREMFNLEGVEDDYLYVRKLDDDLLCFISYATRDGKKFTPEKFEAMFE